MVLVDLLIVGHRKRRHSLGGRLEKNSVEFDRELRRELEQIAPDWQWICESGPQSGQPHVQVYGKHRSRGLLTMPFSFQRPSGPAGSPKSLAEFICRSLSTIHREVEIA